MNVYPSRGTLVPLREAKLPTVPSLDSRGQAGHPIDFTNCWLSFMHDSLTSNATLHLELIRNTPNGVLMNVFIIIGLSFVA